MQGTRERDGRVCTVLNRSSRAWKNGGKEAPRRAAGACPGRSNLLSHRCFATVVRLKRGNIGRAQAISLA